jgi:hypothetical protein
MPTTRTIHGYPPITFDARHFSQAKVCNKWLIWVQKGILRHIPVSGHSSDDNGGDIHATGQNLEKRIVSRSSLEKDEM